MTSEHPKEWHAWLPLAQWWYNTHFYSATQMTPYEVVYGQSPPLYLPYLPGESKIDEVDRSLQRREEMMAMLKFHLGKAQARMKHQADKHRSERSFRLEERVWLKLQPYRQQSVQQRSNQKISHKYYGPYQIQATIVKVAYKLKLPPTTRIHDVFHVSQLKAFHGNLPIATHIPQWFHGQDASTVLRPQVLLDRRVVKVHNQALSAISDSVGRNF